AGRAEARQTARPPQALSPPQERKAPPAARQLAKSSSRTPPPTPAPVAAVAPPPAPPAAPRAGGLSAAEQERAEHALVQGEQYLARGSILVARQYFLLAADAGLATAALRLAATYDPVELQHLEVSGVVPDLDLARTWYERARELGALDAEALLARLN